MPSTSINNPHDHFFRHSFSNSAISKPFFQHFLPLEIREHLDLGTLKAEPESFVDEQLADHHADLLFSVRRRDGRPRLPEILLLFRQLEDRQDDALAYLGTVLRYIASVARQVDRQTLEAAVKAALPTTMGENAMSTIAESWIEEGRQEGKAEEARLLLRKLLVRHFGPLPDEIDQRIEQADQATLNRWFDRALIVDGLDDVFANA